MKRNKHLFFLLLALMFHQAKADNKVSLNLSQCIEYAVEHNIQIKQLHVSQEQQEVSLREAQAALFPSLSFGMNQSATYLPLQKKNDGIVGNGSYALNASFTVWNGKANTNKIKIQKLNTEQTRLNTEISKNSITEEITQLYLQILYSNEAEKVNERILQTTERQLQRGKEMVSSGLMSETELKQLEAQHASAQYDVVQAQTQIDNYMLELKQLLELDPETDFEITSLKADDLEALQNIPNSQDVYQKALLMRPEIKSRQLAIEMAKRNIQVAKAGYQPSIILNASVSDNHNYSANIASQFKNNLNGSVGITLSVPIFDNRKTKSAIQQAKLEQTAKSLELTEQQKELYNTIEKYNLQARNNQEQFRASLIKVESMESSYKLLNEQFENGLKNVVELLTAKDNLLQAQQEKLQSKYTTLLNIQLLKFYQGNPISLTTNS